MPNEDITMVNMPAVQYVLNSFSPGDQKLEADNLLYLYRSNNTTRRVDPVLIASWLNLMENVRNRDRKKAFYWEPLHESKVIVLPKASVIEKNLEKVEKLR